MYRRISKQRLILNLLAIIGILSPISILVYSVAERTGYFSDRQELIVFFERIDGLRRGDQVRLQGLRAGIVSQIDPPVEAGGHLLVHLEMDPTLARLLKKDADAVIVGQGLIGQVVIDISPGNPKSEPFDFSKPMTGRVALNLGVLSQKAFESLSRLDMIVSEAEKGLKQVNDITGRINRGEGSLGRFVMQNDTYDQVARLSKRSEQTIDDLQENLQALKRSWFFSKSFEERGFYERDLILFNPTSSQFRKTLEIAGFFEPASAILTSEGKSRIDKNLEVLQNALSSSSELVIAVFDQSQQTKIDEQTRRLLTQRQAEAIRDYLVKVHQLSYIGIFQSRKVVAIGYGSQPPSHWKNDQAIDQWVDLVVITPRG